jgi:NAD(P)-dependent dehydrogenase (short-subunit alcohol dehydrogenase family)
MHVIVTDLEEATASDTARLLESGSAFRLDVTNSTEIEALMARIEDESGPIDVLVNNAGVSTMNHVWELTEEEWGFNFDVNTKGVFLMTRAVAPRLIGRRRGVIVNIASMAGKKAVPLLAHYAASKWACIGFTKSVAVELGQFGIRVNCVCPGYVETSMQQRELEWEANLREITVDDVMKDYLRLTPLGRIETAEDVAKVVSFLCSDDAAFVTGAAIDVTGGANLT